jgi:hypothetical protein
LVDYIRPEQELPILSETLNAGDLEKYSAEMSDDGQEIYHDIQDRMSDKKEEETVKKEDTVDSDLSDDTSETKPENNEVGQLNYVNVNDQVSENISNQDTSSIMISGTQEITSANSNSPSYQAKAVPPYHPVYK